MARRARSRSPRARPALPYMQIFVKPMLGRRILLDVLVTDTIDEVKAKIQARNIPPAADGLAPGLHPNLQRLIFQGANMRGSFTLADYGVQHFNTIQLRWSHVEQETYDTAD